QLARVVVGHVNTTRLDLSLYRLDTQEFFRTQQNWWDYNPSGNSIREWSVPVESPLNETSYTLADLVEGGGTLVPGLYLLDMKAPGVEYDRWGHRKLLAVSEYNLTLKAGQDEMWAWATDLATGRPAAGFTLTAQNYDGDFLGSATTDGDGLARFDLDARNYGAVYVVGEEQFVLAGTERDWSAGISPWDFGLEQEYRYGDCRAHLYTDRPIYRPGQTVYFRGVVRAEDDVRYSLPAGGAVQVTIYDAAGEQLYQDRLTLDEFGAFHSELALAEGTSLGVYVIETFFDGERFTANFTIAAYRPPEFEVTVTPEKAELIAGQSTHAEVEVRYFFGGPVADASVEWNVLAAPYRFEPAQFGRYDFTDEDDPWLCRWCWWREPPAPNVVLSGAGQTDGDGNLTIELPTSVMTGGQRLTVEATVYGKDGQVISGRGDVVVHAGEFYVGLAPQRYVGEAGDEFGVDVVTVDWDGGRVSRQELEVEVYRREWVNTFIENDLGGGAWEWETVDTLVYSDTLTTGSNAEAVITFTPQEGGSYRVVAQSRLTPHVSRSSTWVWVS
ncbi:MAG: MG2 domain-containing protein, partial [Chloroflexota bacterium]|nr:MG2 domain-containing protein [Chloroflexota bacterium]